MSKKKLIHEGMMQQTRVFVGRDGVTARVRRQFSIAFDGTPTRPGASDLIRVKVQDSCGFDVQSIIDDLDATDAGIFVGSRGKFLIFEKNNALKASNGAVLQKIALFVIFYLIPCWDIGIRET